MTLASPDPRRGGDLGGVGVGGEARLDLPEHLVGELPVGPEAVHVHPAAGAPGVEHHPWGSGMSLNSGSRESLVCVPDAFHKSHQITEQIGELRGELFWLPGSSMIRK